MQNSAYLAAQFSHGQETEVWMQEIKGTSFQVDTDTW